MTAPVSEPCSRTPLPPSGVPRGRRTGAGSSCRRTATATRFLPFSKLRWLPVALKRSWRRDTSYLDCPQWSPKGDAIVLTIDPTTDPRRGDIWKRWKENPLAPWRSDLAILDLESGQFRRLVGGVASTITGIGRATGAGSSSRATDTPPRTLIPSRWGTASAVWRPTSSVRTAPAFAGSPRTDTLIDIDHGSSDWVVLSV
jgi:hypothetical protein